MQRQDSNLMNGTILLASCTPTGSTHNNLLQSQASFSDSKVAMLEDHYYWKREIRRQKEERLR